MLHYRNDPFYRNKNSVVARQNKLDTVSQPSVDNKCLETPRWTMSPVDLEGFPQLWIDEIDSISELLKPLKQNPQSMHHIEDPGMTSVATAPSPEY